MTVEAMMDAARRLSRQERNRLMSLLEDMDEEQNALDLTDAEKAEIRRRVKDHRAHPERAVPWDEAKAKALARFKP